MTSEQPEPQQANQSEEVDDEGRPIEKGDFVIELRPAQGGLLVPYVSTKQ